MNGETQEGKGGKEEPLHMANQSVPVLLEELGIPMEEVRQALEEGGCV